MLPATKRRSRVREPYVARRSSLVRATESGMLSTIVPLGGHVKKGDPLGVVDDPYSGARHVIQADRTGVVIGRLELPLVHEGDAVYHVARFKDDEEDVAEGVEQFQSVHGDEPTDGDLSRFD